MANNNFITCIICGYEFSEELMQADKEFAIEVHNRIHKGEFNNGL